MDHTLKIIVLIALILILDLMKLFLEMTDCENMD